MEQINLKKALQKTKIKAEWIGLREVKEISTQRLIRDLNPGSNHTTIDHGIMAEVLSNGQFGYYAVNDISYESINFAIEKAHNQALKASKYSLHSFNESVRPKSVGSYQSPYKLKNMELEQLMDILMKSNKELKNSDKIVSAISMARIVDMNMKFVSTNGSDFEQNFMYVGPGFRAIAQDGNIVQSRSYTDQCQQSGMEVFEENRVLNRCESICKEAVELLTAEECPTGKMDLVLHSDQMLLQIHEKYWACTGG